MLPLICQFGFDEAPTVTLGSRIVLKTEQLIRELRDSDLSTLAELRRDRELQDVLLAHPAEGTVSDQDVRTWLNRRIADETGCFFVIDDGTGKCAGFVQLTQLHRRSGHAYFGVAVSAAARGKGFGGRAVKAIIAHGAAEFGCRKILAEVRADNEASHRMCAALGFKPVGTLHKHYKAFDVTLYELLL